MWSLSDCHVVSYERLPTKTVVPLPPFRERTGPPPPSPPPSRCLPPLSSRTTILRPSSSVSIRVSIAFAAPASSANSTMPKPAERPSCRVFTLARTTSPASFMWSLSVCHDVSYERLPT